MEALGGSYATETPGVRRMRRLPDTAEIDDWGRVPHDADDRLVAELAARASHDLVFARSVTAVHGWPSDEPPLLLNAYVERGRRRNRPRAAEDWALRRRAMLREPHTKALAQAAVEPGVNPAAVAETMARIPLLPVEQYPALVFVPPISEPSEAVMWYRRGLHFLLGDLSETGGVWPIPYCDVPQ